LASFADFDAKEQVRTATDIVDVVGRELELRPQGRNFVARCPFHNDTRPSMQVNPERQSWKCWVCDIGGDVFSYVMRREGVDFPTALRTLAERAGIELPEFRRGPKTQPGQPDDRDTLLATLDLVAQAYVRELVESKSDDAAAARDYLASRGIDDEARQRFRIGFAPDSWDFALRLLQREGYSEAVARAAGLAIARGGETNSDGSYDRFRGRLMFPIRNLQGQTISFGGRIVPAIAERIAAARGDESSGGAKYINGPETMLFRKSRELYGLDLARDAIRQAGEVLVMEGYTDVIAARMAGIEPAVAVLGTALTSDHVRLLKRFTSRVVLVLDGDAAGRRRADEVLELFVRADIDLRVLTLPEGMDPADFLSDRSAEALRELAQAAPDAMDHKLSRLTEGVDVVQDTHRVTAAVETMLNVMSGIPEDNDKGSLKTDQMLMRMSQTFSLPAERLQRRLDAIRQNRNRNQRAAAARSRRAASATRRQSDQPVSDGRLENVFDGESFDAPLPSKLSPLSGIDRELFETLLESPDVAGMAIESIDAEWLSSTTAKMLLSAYQDLDLQARELDSDSLLTLVENDFLKNQIVGLLERIEQRQDQPSDRPIASPQARYTAILLRYREREFDAEKHRQIEKLRSAVLAEDEEMALLEELFAAEKIRHTPR